jgi:imidazolonepropionase
MRKRFTNIQALHGILEGNTQALRKSDLGKMQSIENAWICLEDGQILDYGSMDNIPESTVDIEISLEGKSMLPAWCDSHTHLVFAASRENEFVDRVKGVSYEEIARKGGGILNSAKNLNAASEDELYDSAMLRLAEVQALGTAAIEIKSGYGLSVEGEIKMLRVIRRIKESTDMIVKSNFLAAHAYPMEYRENHQGYIKLIIEEMLPQIAAEGLADYVDAFCEKGFFSVDETAQILDAAAKYNLKPKIHANQLHYSGGVQVGVKFNAVSVDHLECVAEEELNLLANSSTIATILPSAAYFLGIGYQPARKMIDGGAAVALASDYNPGSSPSGSMPFITSLACTQLKMTPEEAVNACTINAAYAIESQDLIGSISRGKIANLIITKNIPSLAYIPYAFGSNCIEQTIVKGK